MYSVHEAKWSLKALKCCEPPKVSIIQSPILEWQALSKADFWIFHIWAVLVVVTHYPQWNERFRCWSITFCIHMWFSVKIDNGHYLWENHLWRNELWGMVTSQKSGNFSTLPLAQEESVPEWIWKINIYSVYAYDSLLINVCTKRLLCTTPAEGL